jgi:hypothetical protein
MNSEILEFPSQRKIETDKAYSIIVEEARADGIEPSDQKLVLLREVAGEIAEAKIKARKLQRAEDERLAREWDNPELVADDKEFKTAAEWLGKLHPDTRWVALELLSRIH